MAMYIKSYNILNWELQDDIRRVYKKALEKFENFVRIQYLDRYLDKCNWFDISVSIKDNVKRMNLWLCKDNEYGNYDRLQLASVSTEATEGMICDLFEHLIYKNLEKLKRLEVFMDKNRHIRSRVARNPNTSVGEK